MKIFVFYICCGFALVSLTSAQNVIRPLATFEEFDKCLNETNRDVDDMFTVRDLASNKHELPENVKKQKKDGCVIYCLLSNAGVMEGSEFKIQKMHDELSRRLGNESDSSIHKILDDCVNKSNNVAESCQKSFDLMACYMKAQYKMPENKTSEE